MWRRFCSSVPKARMAGPTMVWAIMNAPLVTPKRSISSAKISSSTRLPPRPPCSTGYEIPAQPPSKRVRCHAVQRTTSSSQSASGSKNDREKSSGCPFGTACSVSQALASARKAASSGVSSKSTTRDCNRF